MVKKKKSYLQRKWIKTIQRIRAYPFCLYYWIGCIKVSGLRWQFKGIQLKAVELLRIIKAIREFEHCNMLVFGLGNDSQFWREVNRNGRNVFLEDYKLWFDKITGELPGIESYLVSYTGKITEWKEMINQPEKLTADLPQEVAGVKWDVILVDGPRGHINSEDQPGRMSSIYTASLLVKPGGYVFVHDAERDLEDAFSAKYLGKDQEIATVRGSSLLKVFHFPGPEES